MLTTPDTKPAGFALRLNFFLAATPERSHPFPSRTRKLSSPGPMVLQGQLCGRVGRCRGFEGSVERLGPLLFFGRSFSARPVLIAGRIKGLDRPMSQKRYAKAKPKAIAKSVKVRAREETEALIAKAMSATDKSAIANVDPGDLQILGDFVAAAGA